MLSVDLPECRLRTAASNYLFQALQRETRRLALPAPNGVSLQRCGPDGLPAEETSFAEVAPGKAVVGTLALCPAAPELLAVSHMSAHEVHVHALGRGAAATAPLATLALGGAARHLAWHPTRRVLAVVTPNRTLLFEVGAHGASDAIVMSPLGEHAGAIRTCCWSGGGSALAVATESELHLYSWAVPGAWKRSVSRRLALPARRLCAVVSVDDHTFALALALPIAVTAAATAAAATPLLTAAAPRTAREHAEHAAAASDVIDLRGVVGTDAPVRSVLDLSDELRSAEPAMPAQMADELAAAAAKAAGSEGDAQGAGPASEVVAVRMAGDQLALLPHAASLHLSQPDMLAAAAPDCRRSDAPDECDAVGAELDGSARAAAPLFVAATSSTGGGVALLAYADPSSSSSSVAALTLLRYLDCEQSGLYRPRGLAFFTEQRLLVLRGKRLRASAVFSSPAAEQALQLHSHELHADTAALAASGADARAHESSAPTSGSTSVGDGRQTACGITAGATDAEATARAARPSDNAPACFGSEVASAMYALQLHIDERFDRLERTLARMESRVASLEHVARER